MSLTVEGATNNVITSASNTITCSLTSTHQNGRAMCFFMNNGAQTASCSSTNLGSWTQLFAGQLGAGAGNWNAIFYKDFTTALSSETVTVTSTGSTYLVMHAWCGVETTNVALTFDVDTVNSQTIETATAAAAPAFHTATAAAMVIGV